MERKLKNKNKVNKNEEKENFIENEKAWNVFIGNFYMDT